MKNKGNDKFEREDDLEILETPLILFKDERFSGLSKTEILLFSLLLKQTKIRGTNSITFSRNEVFAYIGICENAIWYRHLPKLKDVGLVSSLKKKNGLRIVDVCPEKLYG